MLSRLSKDDFQDYFIVDSTKIYHFDNLFEKRVFKAWRYRVITQQIQGFM